MQKTSAQTLKDCSLVVIKIGSVLVRGETLDRVNQGWMDAFAQDVSQFIQMGKKVVIVSSGGVALGRKALNISPDISPDQIPLAKKQASSAVGQYHVFNGYHTAFARHGITAAQVLLTMGETENRRMNLNAREALHTLLEHNIIPVINENDVVSTGEIRFGDNDRLAARAAQMIGADCVVLLSTIDGLYTDNPQITPDAEHISVIETLAAEHVAMAGEALSGLSSGGMKSKIEAAQAATKSGIHLIITDGQEDHAFAALIDGSRRSSLFIADENGQSARKSWIGSHMNPKGAVMIDDGAFAALQRGTSLLPIGVRSVEGRFERGDVIEVRTFSGEKVAMGLSAYSSENTEKLIGKNSADIPDILGYIGREEIIHRNDLVMI